MKRKFQRKWAGGGPLRTKNFSGKRWNFELISSERGLKTSSFTFRLEASRLLQKSWISRLPINYGFYLLTGNLTPCTIENFKCLVKNNGKLAYFFKINLSLADSFSYSELRKTSRGQSIFWWWWRRYCMLLLARVQSNRIFRWNLTAHDFVRNLSYFHNLFII